MKREHDSEDREVKGKLKYRKNKAHRGIIPFPLLILVYKHPTSLFLHINTEVLSPSYLRKQSIFDTSQAKKLMFILTAGV
jgi:hypothetical protein